MAENFNIQVIWSYLLITKKLHKKNSLQKVWPFTGLMKPFNLIQQFGIGTGLLKYEQRATSVEQ